MGDHYQCLMKCGSGHFEKSCNILRGLHIKTSGGFIRQDNGRLCDQCPCDGRTLLRSAGKHMRESIQMVLQPQHFYKAGKIPGIRPGKPTVEYLTKILNYIIFVGACGLILVQLVPILFNGWLGAQVSFGGTSLIIIVSVVLETMKQIESQMLVRNYKGFLNT